MDTIDKISDFDFEKETEEVWRFIPCKTHAIYDKIKAYGIKCWKAGLLDSKISAVELNNTDIAKPAVKEKHNALFEECLKQVDPKVRKEVYRNIDKLLDTSVKETSNTHYYVYKDGRSVSDYLDFEQAQKHADQIGGTVAKSYE